MRDRPPSAGGSVDARMLAEEWRLYVRAARQDPNYFAELILRDEQSFAHVRQARHHREFQRIWGEKRASIIFAHPESGKCETADSRITLATGEDVSIAALTHRERVLVVDPVSRDRRAAWCRPVESNGVRPIVRIEVEDGRVWKVTAEHPFWVQMRSLVDEPWWARASEILPGDFLYSDRLTLNRVSRVDFLPPEETWALEIEDPAHCYVSNGVISHNTNQAVARVLWMLGHNPRLKILFVSKTISAAEDRLKLAKQYILDSDALAEVFPRLKLDKKGRNHSRALTVEREGGYAIKDASIKAVGLNGNVLGARVDVIVLDDWIDLLIARTEAPRRAALQWFRSNNCYGRLTAGGRVIILTNAWHPTDPNEVLAAPPPDGSGFYSQRFPSIDDDGRPTYPERWGEERIREVRVAMGEAEFARAHLCKPQEEGAQACKAEWLERCYKRGLGSPVFSSLRSFEEDDRSQPGELRLSDAYSAGLAAPPDSRPSWGRAVAEAEELMEREEGAEFCPVAIVHGVDSAFQTHNASDLSAIVTAAVYRNGHKRLLRVKSGRWDIVRILQEIEQTWCYFGGTFIVENNGGAQHIITALRANCPIRVFGFLTGDNKFKPGTNIQTLFASFHDAQWIIPSQQAVVEDELEDARGNTTYAKRVTPFYALDPEIEALSRDCLNFDPLSHTGDRLMAMWFVQRYAVRLFGGDARGFDAPTLVPAVGMMPEARIVVPEPPVLLPSPPPRVIPPGRFMRGSVRG